MDQDRATAAAVMYFGDGSWLREPDEVFEEGGEWIVLYRRNPLQNPIDWTEAHEQWYRRVFGPQVADVVQYRVRQLDARIEFEIVWNCPACMDTGHRGGKPSSQREMDENRCAACLGDPTELGANARADD